MDLIDTERSFTFGKHLCFFFNLLVFHPCRGKLEERVSVLEVQVADLDNDVDFLFDDQVIQDERFLGLEQGIHAIESDLDVIDDEVEGDFAF